MFYGKRPVDPRLGLPGNRQLALSQRLAGQASRQEGAIMSPSSTLADLALSVDALLTQSAENITAAHVLVESYLAGRAQGNVEPIPFPEDPDGEDYQNVEGDVVLTPVQRAAALVALRDAHCLGVEKIIAIPATLPALAPEDKTTKREWQRALSWRATIDRVQRLGNYSVPWFRAQLSRFEQELSSPPVTLQGNATGVPRRPAPTADDWIWAPSGNGYLVAGLGERGHLAGLKGLGMIAQLVRSPGQPVPMNLLVAEKVEPPTSDPHSPQPAMDEKALKEACERMSALRAEFEQAESEGRSLEAEESRKEFEEVRKQVNVAVKIGGQPRDLNNPGNRLRPSIQAALVRVYRAMREAKPPMPKLAEHLESATSAEGLTYVYRPAMSPPPSWKTESVALSATE
jgi:hypothetical protein